MPCWVEGATLTVAFSIPLTNYDALMMAGGEIIYTVMMSICICCPSVLNFATVMHI